jgi:hypothetical protein
VLSNSVIVVIFLFLYLKGLANRTEELAQVQRLQLEQIRNFVEKTVAKLTDDLIAVSTIVRISCCLSFFSSSNQFSLSLSLSLSFSLSF